MANTAPASAYLKGMKAVVHTDYGGPEVLQLTDIPTPTPAPNELLVKVHAAALNPVDWHLVRGVPFPIRMMVGGLRRPKHRRGVGGDFAGTIAAVGSAVTGLTAGDPVFGYSERAGALAEYLAVPADKVAPKPQSLTFEQAAAVPLAAMTALQLLRNAKLQSGHRVLIVGAAGGIGTFAVQLARATGAHVTAVQSTSVCELVRSLGADRAIDYTQEDFTTGEARYDIVFDNVSNRALRDVLRVMTPGGTLIPNGGGSPDANVMGGLVRLLVKKPFVTQKIMMGVTKPNRADLQALAGMIDAGTIRPVVDRCYPLAAAADAFRHLEGGHAHGKIVMVLPGT
jgi:NADPH:quinone reductase-like Zn-dependent oxidoreductase